MDKEELELLVGQGLGTRVIAKHLDTSPNNVRYWVRKHGLTLQQKPFGAGYEPILYPHRCCTCGEDNPVNFYGHKRKICGPCQNVYNTKRARAR